MRGQTGADGPQADTTGRAQPGRMTRERKDRTRVQEENMPYNQHELKRRAQTASIAQTRATAERAARNAGKRARPKARRQIRVLDTIIQPERWLRRRPR